MITLDTKRMQKFSRDLIKAGGIAFSSQLDKMLEETQELREAKIIGDPVEIIKEAYDVLQAANTLLCLTTDRDDLLDRAFEYTGEAKEFSKSDLDKFESLIKEGKQNKYQTRNTPRKMLSFSMMLLACREYRIACVTACSLIANAKGVENEKKYKIGEEK